MVSNIGGFHALAAAGLPNRYITAIVQDPADKYHVYVTESGFARNWIPSAGFGHVFESTDGGATFTDISGNLPDAPVSSAVLDGSNLIVGTDTGVYEQAGPGTWAPLGTGHADGRHRRPDDGARLQHARRGHARPRRVQAGPGRLASDRTERARSP